jgi:serine/threonine protein kinase
LANWHGCQLLWHSYRISASNPILLPLVNTNEATPQPAASSETSVVAEASLVGSVIGNYRLVELIGRGGMGTVYRGQHEELRRFVALKILRPKYSGNEEALQRFFNEARATSAIDHPGIVKIFDFGRTADGLAFIAMELLRGESLSHRIEVKPLSEQRALGIIRQLASALAAAHAIGIVHRDLKPDNIFLCIDPDMADGERIKLLDFGIAKLALPDETTPAPALTQTGTLMGTPSYMSPEQCRGVKVDLRSDIYALGCILFELISGRLVFLGEGAGDLIVAHISEPPPLLMTVVPGTTPAVADITARLLAKLPAQRPPTCNALIEAIDRVIAGGVLTTAIAPKPAPKPAEIPSDSDIWLAPKKTGVETVKIPKHRLPIGKYIVVGTMLVFTILGYAVCRNSRQAAAPAPPLRPTNDATLQFTDTEALVAPRPPDTLPPIPTGLTVHVTTLPPNATIFVDNLRVGSSPLTWTRPAQQANRKLIVTVQLSGYRDNVFEVSPSAVGEVRHVLTLAPLRRR